MNKILNIQNLNQIQHDYTKGRKLVLVGGCFDILHKGHIQFLNEAKKLGDCLIVLIESDEKVRKLKGEKRPINSQKDRAIIVSNLSPVDYVLSLPYLKNNSDYEEIVKKIEPDIIAITQQDNVFDWEREFAKSKGVKIKIIEKNGKYSTTGLIEKIKF